MRRSLITTGVVALVACSGTTPDNTAAPSVDASADSAGKGDSSSEASGAGSAGTGGAIDAPEACSSSSLAVTLRPAAVILLVDRSESMNCNAPPVQSAAECSASPATKDEATPTKWALTRDALASALSPVAVLNPTPHVALSLFNTDDHCGCPITPEPALAALDSAHLNAIADALESVVPSGDAPISDSLTAAWQHLQAHSNGTNPSVVMLTDGDDTCDPESKPDAISQASQVLQDAGIRTFVLGVSGSEQARSFLSRLADAGGTASSTTCDHSSADPSVGDCQLDLTESAAGYADALQQALQQVLAAANPCVLDVTTDVDPNKVNVRFTSHGEQTEISPSLDASCDSVQSSWRYVDASKKVIQICGLMCDAIQHDPDGELRIVVGCDFIPK